jgi:hypothetical protein
MQREWLLNPQVDSLLCKGTQNCNIGSEFFPFFCSFGISLLYYLSVEVKITLVIVPVMAVGVLVTSHYFVIRCWAQKVLDGTHTVCKGFKYPYDLKHQTPPVFTKFVKTDNIG